MGDPQGLAGLYSGLWVGLECAGTGTETHEAVTGRVLLVEAHGSARVEMLWPPLAAGPLTFQGPKPAPWPGLVPVGQGKVLPYTSERRRGHRAQGSMANSIDSIGREGLGTIIRRPSGRASRGCQVIPDSAEHSRPPHGCQPRCRVAPVPEGTPASADCLLELQQSQPNPSAFSAPHVPRGGCVCRETRPFRKDQSQC